MERAVAGTSSWTPRMLVGLMRAARGQLPVNGRDELQTRRTTRALERLGEVGWDVVVGLVDDLYEDLMSAEATTVSASTWRQRSTILSRLPKECESFYDSEVVRQLLLLTIKATFRLCNSWEPPCTAAEHVVVLLIIGRLEDAGAPLADCFPSIEEWQRALVAALLGSAPARGMRLGPSGQIVFVQNETAVRSPRAWFATA